MIIRNSSINDLERALRGINAGYENNIYLNSKIDTYNCKPCHKVTLHYSDKNKKGARLFNKSNNNFPCIHVYKNFFNILLWINRNIVVIVYSEWIISRTKTGKILGNIDKNDPSIMHKINPGSFLCKCNKDKINGI